ncbi:MAG: helix-turn-helix transcriptional regulator [Firmicutes bacterium]|nr:helix-turn-helix transcriptional regulator [Bacillota bacterium]
MTKKELKSMGDRMKSKRLQLGYTQERVAELTDISFSTYSKIENAIQSPSLDTLIRISIVLDISMDYLIFGNENIKKDIDDFSDIITLLQNADFKQVQYVYELLSQLLSKAK